MKRGRLASPAGQKYGLPPFPFFIFGVAGLAGAAGDLKVIMKGAPRGVPRLRRHLWRMCLALWVATTSFFSIRERVARVLPDPLVTPAVQLLPIVQVLVALVFWLWRVGRKGWASGGRRYRPNRDARDLELTR